MSIKHKSINPGYTELQNNAFVRAVGTGVNRNTGFENRRLEYYHRSIAEIEALYCSNTDGLIGALDGTIRMHDTDGKSNDLFMQSGFEGEPADYAIFLDKSARPIARLVRDLWDYIAQDDVPKPEIRFLNIDKEIWLQRMGFSTAIVQDVDPIEVDIDKIDPDSLHDHLTRIRSLFLEPSDFDQLDESNLDEAWSMPTIFDGKNVAIVDEVKSSGNTLRIALQLLQRAFPDARFSSVYWATPPLVQWEYLLDNEVQKSFCSSFVPVWYNRDSASGRGIDDIDPLYSEQSKNKAQRIGKFVLGTPYHNPGTTELRHDALSSVIRSDLKLLSERIKAGKALFRPSPQRLRADFRHRAAKFNDCTFEQYKKRAQAL